MLIGFEDPCAEEVFKTEDAVGIAAVSWDVRQTLVWPEYGRVAEIACRHGYAITAEHLRKAMPYASWMSETVYADRASYTHLQSKSFPVVWGEAMRTWIKGALSERPPVPEAYYGEINDAVMLDLWNTHVARTFWRKPDQEAHAALEMLQRRHIKMGVVSNDEGGLFESLEDAKLSRFFNPDHILASSKELIRKPDPVIFWRLSDRLGEDEDAIIHIGNQPTIDVDGALDAGMRAALYDPFGVWNKERLRPGVKRVRSLKRFAECIVQAQRDSSRPERTSSPIPPSSP